MNAQVPNLEEAANVAAEFIYSIDNLPNEVSHLLQEIRHRESRTQELQLEIDKDAAKYIRHSRRASSASVTPPSPSSRAPSPKSVPIPARISASYAEMQDLAVEKCALAEQLIEIISRTRAKLDLDIIKVRTLQGESPELIAAAMGRQPTFSADNFAIPGRNPALAISESLRNALAIPAVDLKRSASVVFSAPSPSPSTSHVPKKRKVTQSASIKISPAATPTKHRSASPTTVAPIASHTQPKSRLSRQVHPPTDDDNMDLDGDEDGDGEEENEDETPYCYCRKQSYGDMIACDNEDGCPNEWFHLACVDLKQPPPEKWYCRDCEPKFRSVEQAPPPPSGRKGRKK